MRALTRILLLVLVAAVAAEGWARFGLDVKPGAYPENTLAAALGKFVEPDLVTGIRYKSNVDTLLQSPDGEFSVLYKTNEINLRDRSMGTHLRSELKFLVLGDEFAEGWGVEIDEVAAVVAQKQVNEKTGLKPAVRLVIGAKSGYGAAQNYLQGKALIETLQPKGILFFYSSLMPYADQQFLATARLQDGLAIGATEQAPRALHLEDYPPAASGLLATLAPYSAAARWLGDQLRVSPAANGRLLGVRGNADTIGKAHQASLKHVEALAALAKARNIPFLLVHVPLPTQVAAAEWRGGRARFGARDLAMDSADVSVVAGFCKARGLHWASPVEPLRAAANGNNARPLYFNTEIGFSAEGNRVFGTWLAGTLLDWMTTLGLR